MLSDHPVKAKPQSFTTTKKQTGREVCQHYPLTFFIKPHNLPAFSTLLSSLFQIYTCRREAESGSAEGPEVCIYCLARGGGGER